MREGDLLFFCGRSLLSRMIRARTLSAISHVGMLVTLNNELWVAESLEGHGLRVVPLSVWAAWDGTILVGHNSMSAARRALAARYMLEHVGDGYASWRQFLRSFSFGWSRIARALRLQVDVERHRASCSEAVSYALRAGDYWLPMAPAAMSPTDVAELSIVTGFTKWPVPHEG